MAQLRKGIGVTILLLRSFYVSMDVIFHEKVLFYPTRITDSSLQGESRDEVQNQDEIRFFEIMRPSSIEVETADTSFIECSVEGREDQVHDSTLPPTSTNPLTQSSSEDSLEVLLDPIPVVSNIHDIVSITEPASEPSQYHLPPRSNRGQPATRYEPDPKSKAKYPISNHVSSHKLSESYASYVLQLSSVSIPSKLQEAVADPRWTKAMAEEMTALEKNATWELVPLPKGKKTVGCRWVFTVKHKADGTIERYKARLVAKGYTQSYGVDYQETFAPVAKLNTVRVLLSLAANQDWPLLQFDVKNAFLHGDLTEEVYMDPPPGITKYSDITMVCKTEKGLVWVEAVPKGLVW